MPTLSKPSHHLIVCSTITKHGAHPFPTPPATPGATHPSKAGQTRPPPWYDGLSPDQQDEYLDRIDPAQYGPTDRPPMPTTRWNREKRRVRRLRERWITDIRSLRRICHCDNCRRHRRPPFPPYYVANAISYECWLEQQEVDPELEEDLAALRNDRRRVGAVMHVRHAAE